MEVIIFLISILLGFGIIITPILFLRSSMQFDGVKGYFIFNIINVSILSILAVVQAWWADAAIDALLYYYGMEEAISLNLENVAPENIERVKELYNSQFGVGWPVKAFFAIVFCLPYPSFVLFAKYVFSKFKSAPNKVVQSDLRPLPPLVQKTHKRRQ